MANFINQYIFKVFTIDSSINGNKIIITIILMQNFDSSHIRKEGFHINPTPIVKSSSIELCKLKVVLQKIISEKIIIMLIDCFFLL